MRNIVYLMVIVFALDGCKSKQSFCNDWKTLKLKGDVVSIHETEYIAVEKFGEVVKGGMPDLLDVLTPINEAMFNEQGNLISECSYLANGRKYDSTNFVYNGAVKFGANTFDSLNQLASMQLFTYDIQGNLIDWSYLNADSSLGRRIKSVYNAKGDKIEEFEYLYDGRLFSRYEYEYDNHGFLIKTSNYSGNDDFNMEAYYVNDKSGNPIEIQTNFPLLENAYKMPIAPIYYSYKYDNVGNWIERIEYNGQSRKPKRIAIRKINYKNVN